MPIALDPNQTFPIWLESDADKSPRPEFQFRAVNIRDRLQVDEHFEYCHANQETIKAREIVDRTLDIFTRLCSGWTNMVDADGAAIPYEREAIYEFLSHEEIWELINKAVRNSHVSHDEKKSSES